MKKVCPIPFFGSNTVKESCTLALRSGVPKRYKGHRLPELARLVVKRIAKAMANA